GERVACEGAGGGAPVIWPGLVARPASARIVTARRMRAFTTTTIPPSATPTVLPAGGETDAGSDEKSRQEERWRQRVTADHEGDEHAENGSRERPRGERARPVPLHEVHVHDEVEPGDDGPLIEQRDEERRRVPGGNARFPPGAPEQEHAPSDDGLVDEQLDRVDRLNRASQIHRALTQE